MSRLANARILVIEDNQDLADNLIEILEDEGAQVLLAGTAAEARATMAEPFDVALVDVQLPDSSGLALLPDLKHAGALAEVVLISGYATIEDATEAVSGGAYAYILKPFRIEDIVATVERACRQVRSSRTEHELTDQIRLREANLRALVETVQALLLVLDEHGRVVQVNPAVASLTGVPADELIDREWIEDFVIEADRETSRNVLERVLAGEGYLSVENRVRPRPGEYDERVVSWRFAPLREDGDRPLIYVSGLDVTELKQLEERTRLDQRLSAVGTLAAGLAHEIRNPLNSAQLQLRLLERRLLHVSDDEKLRAPIAIVQHEIARLSGLVQEFLAFARPSVLTLEEIDVRAVAERVVTLERHSAEAEGVSIELVAGESTMIRADPDKLQQVLLNLVRNAVDATRDHPEEPRQVTLTVQRDVSGALILVEDNGPGLSDEVMARLFEPFFSTKPQGTGLGMAICHSLVTQHGGDIRVHSEPGHGARFEIHLPRRPPIRTTRGGPRKQA
ncbi:ATP-binding protein [Haliangium sp.]|uniref:hybrid sensor histidine kinase/response regulator n=1 Tax=Haliangium sp. TaxID=2663208 RepID=UPI003D0F3138